MKRQPTKADALIAEYGWESIVEMMNAEIREELHEELAPCDEIEFLTRYIELHYNSFNESFDRVIFG